MTERPNILVMIVHDLGTHLHCYGHDTIRSPRLDRLASEGVRFTNHFACATFCSPSRGAYFTGKYPHSNGLMGLVNLGWDLPDGNVTDAQHFGAGGFETFLFGLQHEVKDVERLGFQNVPECRSRQGADVAAAVGEFLGSRGPGDTPFYARVGFLDVHRFGDGYMPYDDTAPPVDSVEVPAFLEDTPGARREIAQFHECVSQMDTAVGQILDALESNGHADNTLVVFTTDHGIDFPGAKSTLYDPGIRTSLLMRYPGRWSAGAVYDDLLSGVDLLPTLLTATGLEATPELEGRSFLPLLNGLPYEPNQHIFSERNTSPGDTKRCVRTQHWKYIRNFDSGPRIELTSGMRTGLVGRDLGDAHKTPREPVELYDMDSDPHEQVNLAGHAEFAEAEQALRTTLDTWMHETNDALLAGPIQRPAEESEILAKVRARRPTWAAKEDSK